jgi:hypothetical protein
MADGRKAIDVEIQTKLSTDARERTSALLMLGRNVDGQWRDAPLLCSGLRHGEVRVLHRRNEGEIQWY